MPRLAERRHSLLLHRLEQRRLRLRRRAVDFVRQQQVGEHGPWMKRELLPPVAFLQDVASRDVGRQQVRRELNPPEIQRQQSRQRFHEFRLPEPRQTFEQDMPAGEQRGNDFIDHLFLAENHAAQFVTSFAMLVCAAATASGVRRGLGSGVMCGILSAVGASA